MQLDLGGTSMSFGAEYRRKWTEHFWFGGGLSFGLIPKQYVVLPPDPDDREMKVTGQAINLDLFVNFYLNPKAKTRLYLTAGGGGSFININKNNYVDDPVEGWRSDVTESVSSAAFGILGAVGIERSIQDINIGIEARGVYNSYGGDLAGSRSINYYLLLKAGWFF